MGGWKAWRRRREIGSICLYTPQMATSWSFIKVSQVTGRDPKTWATICSFPRSIAESWNRQKEIRGKQNNHVGCECCRLWLYPLWHNVASSQMFWRALAHNQLCFWFAFLFLIWGLERKKQIHLICTLSTELSHLLVHCSNTQITRASQNQLGARNLTHVFYIGGRGPNTGVFTTSRACKSSKVETGARARNRS